MTDQTIITVYVRLCDRNRSNCREISFRIPDGLPQMEVLQHGYAIDGNRAVRQVTERWDVVDRPISGNETEVLVPMAEALHEDQMALVDWLEKQGYTVKFE